MKLAKPLDSRHKDPDESAADRWILEQHWRPHLTVEDVRAGRLPKPSPRERARRQEAVRMAHEIRSKLNIAPLTTSEIIRCLREGTEMNE